MQRISRARHDLGYREWRIFDLHNWTQYGALLVLYVASKLGVKTSPNDLGDIRQLCLIPTRVLPQDRGGCSTRTVSKLDAFLSFLRPSVPRSKLQV